MKTLATLLLTATVALHAAERMDPDAIRNDFFAGIMGNAAALDRAMKATEALLAENPRHAEAMVWHGSGTYALAGKAFASGDRTKAMDLAMRGMAEMEQAVAIAPDNPGVRIPRGSTLMSAGRSMGDANPMARMLFEKALGDYTHIYQLQKTDLDKLGTHPLGELLQGMADMHSRLGNKEKAAEFYQMIAAKLPDTEYARRAAAWLETRESLPPAKAQCVGCHVK